MNKNIDIATEHHKASNHRPYEQLRVDYAILSAREYRVLRSE